MEYRPSNPCSPCPACSPTCISCLVSADGSVCRPRCRPQSQGSRALQWEALSQPRDMHVPCVETTGPSPGSCSLSFSSSLSTQVLDLVPVFPETAMFLWGLNTVQRIISPSHSALLVPHRGVKPHKYWGLEPLHALTV